MGRAPNRALSYPDDPSPHYVWFFTANNNAGGDQMHHVQRTNRVMVEAGQSRVPYSCKYCGLK